MQTPSMRRTPPPGADTLLLDLAAQSAAYRSVWMALVRLAARQTDGPRHAWFAQIVARADALTVLATLRQEPGCAEALLAAMAPHQDRLRACPPWLALIGEPPPTHHGRLALLDKARMDDAAWARLVAFALPHTRERVPPDTDRAWRQFLHLPHPAAARHARKEARQRQRGRTPGPVGGDPSRRPTPQQDPTP